MNVSLYRLLRSLNVVSAEMEDVHFSSEGLELSCENTEFTDDASSFFVQAFDDEELPKRKEKLLAGVQVELLCVFSCHNAATTCMLQD